MARTNVAAQTLAGAYPSLPVAGGSADITFVSGDVANGNETSLVDSKTVALIRNVGVGALSVTFTSTPDTLNRTGDITAYDVAAGETARFGAFKTVGWAHSGKLWIDVEDADVQIAIITLP